MDKCLYLLKILIIFSIFWQCAKLQNCPDGTPQGQACTTIQPQCSNGFVCTNGFCCQTCQFRRQITSGAAFVPQCDLQGNYAAEQCDSSRGQTQCWCCLSNGQEIPNTRIVPGVSPTTRDCNVERQRFTNNQNQCGLNEEWNSCPTPTLCQPACNNIQPNQNCQTLSCVGACVCRSGFVRTTSSNPQSACIQPSQCNNPTAQCTVLNSQFNPCGSACPPSCTNQNPMCSRECVAGCFCNQGFIRQSDTPNAPCVLPNQCTNTGGTCSDANAQFTQCGSNCPPSCTTLNPMCATQCIQTCACKPGFIKQNDNANAPCILPNQCNSVVPGQCTDINSQFSQCGTSCPQASCTTPNPVCINSQCTQGCFCKPGFIKQNDMPNAQCVLQTQCNTAGQCNDINAQFSQCGTSCPQASCTTPNPICTTSQCMQGCFCKPGFMRQNDVPNSPCVMQTQCNTAGQCNDINAQFSQCGTSCPQASCTTPNPVCMSSQCTQGCFCKPGFMRQNDVPNSPCVMQTQCNTVPGQCTDVNSQFSQCGSACPPSCTTPNPNCMQQCTQGCFCRPGFVKQSDAFGAPCVLQSQCSTTPTQCFLPNEELQTCSSTCGNSCNGPLPCAAAQCVPRCLCRAGFVRQTASATSPCVLQNQCVTIPGTKPGVCPALPLFSSNLPKTDYCSTDTSCNGDLKCCDSLIGKVCMGADPRAGM